MTTATDTNENETTTARKRLTTSEKIKAGNVATSIAQAAVGQAQAEFPDNPAAQAYILTTASTLLRASK